MKHYPWLNLLLLKGWRFLGVSISSAMSWAVHSLCADTHFSLPCQKTHLHYVTDNHVLGDITFSRFQDCALIGSNLNWQFKLCDYQSDGRSWTIRVICIFCKHVALRVHSAKTDFVIFVPVLFFQTHTLSLSKRNWHLLSGTNILYYLAKLYDNQLPWSQQFYSQSDS